MTECPNFLYVFLYKKIFFFSKLVIVLNFSLFGSLVLGSEEPGSHNKGWDNPYPEVVRIFFPGRAFNAAGVFVSPDTIVTNFHVVGGFKNSAYQGGFFFANSKIGIVPGKSIKIRSLDGLYDLAALKVEGYQSKFFYPIDSSLDFEKNIKTSKGLTAVGFPKGYFRVEHGSFVENHSFGDSAFIRMSNGNGKYLLGMSGGPVFSDGKLVGIATKADNHNLIFTSADKLKELFLKPDLSCSSVRCVEKERRLFLMRGIGGNKTAQLFIGVEYMRKGDYNKAADWFHKAAVQDLYIAQYYLGKMLSEGKLGSRQLIEALSEGKELSSDMEKEAEKMFKEARYWVEKAATKGRLSEAQVLFGLFLEKGLLNISQDWEKAFYWYKEAATQWHPGAVKKIEEMSKNKDVPLPVRKAAYRLFVKLSRSSRRSAESKKSEIKKNNKGSCPSAF